MENIYLPIDKVSDFACYSISSNGIIRAYYTQPKNNSSSNYIDFDTRNHYFELTGSQSWSQYSSLPTCLSTSLITTDYFYRTDFDSILLIYFILSIIVFYIPLKIVSRLFGRWLSI